MDSTIIITFIYNLRFFIRSKFTASRHELTIIHCFVSIFAKVLQVICNIWFAILMQFLGTCARSFFSPFLIVERQKSNNIVIAFTEQYRLLLYSVSDLVAGIALLYLFYH